jgi:Domain of unknown function (DUF6378)/Domain of unknown function (DUF4406)
LTTQKAQKAYNVYIAGPMRGLPEHNYPAFNSLEDFIWTHGVPGVDVKVAPVNPARNFGGDTTREYADYMRLDIPQLAKCHGIVILPGWETSEGARLEIEIARHLGLDFFYAWKVAAPVLGVGGDGWEIHAGEAPDATWRDGVATLKAPTLAEATEGARQECLGVMRDYLSERNAPEPVEVEASRLVRQGHRQKDYGHPRGDFDTIAALWSPILGAEVNAEKVALCMIALKMARLTSNPKHRDSLVDVIGYAICYDRLDEPLSEEAA